MFEGIENVEIKGKFGELVEKWEREGRKEFNFNDIELTGKWKEIAEQTQEERSLIFEEDLIDAVHRVFNKIPGHLDYYDGLVMGVISAIEFM